ncbi:MAG: DNA mismatch repair endonuclease MutL [Haloarculaceae archaeon]
MTDIRRLDESTVERIAAGEVVERPASVVKELVENSLDAGSDRVEVAVEAGGTEGIRVTDDGRGMTEEAVRRAVEQHTTSKIRDIGDLEAGVGTLGFRGEALHAIGAVSRLTITTRPRPDREDVDADRGTRLRVEGGDVTSVEPAGCPAGTTIEVEDLFYNVPARRKYLKQDATEFAHVNRVATSYALANPDVAVSLSHDGRETFATTGGGDRREAVMAVYGREVAESMVEVDARADAGADGEAGSPDEDADGPGGESSADPLPDGPLAGVSGLVSHPETNRATREYLGTYVNGRYVTADAVRNAVVDAYGTQLAPDRYPFAVLFLDVPAGDVDVNVHPRKLEVRWSEEEAVKEQVQTAVGDALQREGVLRSSAPRGRSAPEQTEIEPSSVSGDTEESATERAETTERDRTAKSNAEATERDRTTKSNADTADTATRDANATDSDEADATRRSSARSASPAHAETTTPSRPSSASSAGSSPDPSLGPSPSDSSPDPTPEPSDSDASPSTAPHERRNRPPTTEPNTQKTLTGEDAHETTEFDNFPDLRVLGQLHDTYVVAEADDGLVLLDQHAADERINYERLQERFEGETTTQALADPVEIELTAREAELFSTYEDALARLGFVASRVDDRTVEVRTVPSLVAESAGPEVVRDVLADMVTGEEAAERTVEAVADELLADMACYPSITGNTSLTDGSVVDLLSTLDECDNPWACPHGRPVLIHVDSDEIDDRFERDYPGHS